MSDLDINLERDRIDFFRRVSIFKGLAEEKLYNIDAACEKLTFPDHCDKPVVSQGDEAPGLYFVFKGKILLTIRLIENIERDWNVWNHRPVSPTNFWGEIELVIPGSKALTTAVPIERPLHLLHIPKDKAIELLRADPEIQLCIMKKMAERYGDRLTLLAEYTLQHRLTISQRFYLLLYRKAADGPLEKSVRELAEEVGAAERVVYNWIKAVTSPESNDYCVEKKKAQHSRKNEYQVIKNKHTTLLRIIEREGDIEVRKRATKERDLEV